MRCGSLNYENIHLLKILVCKQYQTDGSKLPRSKPAFYSGVTDGCEAKCAEVEHDQMETVEVHAH